jgi:hypothetical protein
LDRLAARLTVIAVLGAVLAGCAGGEGDAHPSTDPTPNWKHPNGLVYVTPGLTKKRFMAHLNRYCRHQWPTIQKDPSSYLASIGFYIYSAIQSFGTAPGERGSVENLLFEMKDALREGERAGTADPGQVEAAFADYNVTARRLGLGECLVVGGHLPLAGG